MFLRVVSLVLLCVALIVAILAVYGTVKWNGNTAMLKDALYNGVVATENQRYRESEIRELPPPVREYLGKVLQDGQPIISTVTITHTGTFNMSETEEQWRAFRSNQAVTTNRPGFDWEARIRMFPGLSAKVHDAYIAGTGLLQVSLFGFERLVDLKDMPELDQGEFIRYCAESVWYPTALLPSQGTIWEAVDDFSARATMEDGDNKISLLFRFTREYLVESIVSESRMRTVDGEMVPTPWECRVGDYQVRNNVLIPITGEALWHVQGEELPYWRGTIEHIAYE